MTKIYTKKGDQGMTSLTTSKDTRSKTDDAFFALGDLDELNASIGIIIKNYGFDKLHKIQETLMEISSQLSTGDLRLVASDIQELEAHIDILTEQLPPLKNFILPSSAPEIHLSRAICRRAERNILKWYSAACNLASPDRKKPDRFNGVLEYMNRLSDYLFTLARFAAKRDDTWISRR